MTTEPYRPARVPTSIECPDWCERPPGHAYRDWAEDGLTRTHARTLLRIPEQLSLTIDQTEHAASPSGPIDVEPVTVVLVLDHGAAELDPSALRTLAAGLLDAAALHEALAQPADTTPPTPPTA